MTTRAIGSSLCRAIRSSVSRESGTTREEGRTLRDLEAERGQRVGAGLRVQRVSVRMVSYVARTHHLESLSERSRSNPRGGCRSGFDCSLALAQDGCQGGSDALASYIAPDGGPHRPRKPSRPPVRRSRILIAVAPDPHEEVQGGQEGLEGW